MYNGILVLDKPQGFTSHDVVAKLRGVLRQKRIGHAGTLDPMATGVLAVLLGAATKASEDAAAGDKVYIAGLRPGTVTDTRDIWGTALSQSAKKVEKHELESALEQFRGHIMQKPPMYSAVKIDGQKLYSLARRGVDIDPPAREIFVKKLEITEPPGEHSRPTDGDFLLEIECSKGTYVRSLCHDIGQALGCGACMSSLVRTRSGGLELKHALSFDDVERLHAAGELDSRLAAIDSVYSSLGEIRLTAEGAALAKNGVPVSERHIASGEMPALEGERLRVYTPDGELYMIAVTRLSGGKMSARCQKTFVRQ